MAYGFPTIALAVPLGNYHNQGLEAGRIAVAPSAPHQSLCMWTMWKGSANCAWHSCAASCPGVIRGRK